MVEIQPSYRRGRFVSVLLFVTLSTALLSLAAVVACGMMSDTDATAARPRPLEVTLCGEVAQTNFGTLTPETRLEVPVTLVNNGLFPITLGSISASCECVTIKLEGDRVNPGEKLQGVVALDLSHDPNFKGGLLLSVDADVAGSNGERAFRIEITATVG